MGLDMYLTKRVYVGANYKHNNAKGKIEITTGNENKPLEIKFERISEIIESVGYWRKDNHIHQWFVDNVQEGIDDCKEYYVPKEQLKELIDTCKQILESKEKAEELLPRQTGFFFGSDSYDDDYFNSLEYTINLLTPLLEEEGDFYYSSSW